VKLSNIRLLQQTLSAAPPDPRQLSAQLQALGLDPDNLYQELEMDSRYVDTHRDTSWSNADVSLHSHAFYEVIHCETSCGAEYLVGSERYRLQKGDVVLVPPGVSHRPLLPEHMSLPYQREVLWLSTEFLERFNALLPSDQLSQLTVPRLLRTAGSPWESIGHRFRAGVREAEARLPGWEAMVLGNTIQLAILLGRCMSDQEAVPPRAETPELLDRVLAYISENLTQRLTLPDTARHFFVSESTISHTFRKKLGVSFSRCVTQQRLIAAKTFIGQGLPLEAVAVRAGFADYSSFYRAFRQEYGIGPRQFRKLHTEDGKTRAAAPEI